jgi:hypothetical protein
MTLLLAAAFVTVRAPEALSVGLAMQAAKKERARAE